MSFKCVLFVSADNEFLYNYVKNALAEFEIISIKRFNRDSKINFDEDEYSKMLDFDFLFNFLSPLKVPMSIIKKAKRAAINFHPGSFEYPGVGSASLALFDRKNTYGVTAHLMEAEFDSGDIIAEKFFKIEKNCIPEKLFERALFECCLLFDEVLNQIRSGDEFKKIRDWSRKAVSRKEFEDWMVIAKLASTNSTELKISSILHSKFEGPFIYIGSHKFKYDKSTIDKWI